MYPSFIVLNTDDKLDITKFANFCNFSFGKCEIFIASKTKHQNLDVKEFVFEEENQDKIINTLIPKITGDKLIVLRKIDNNKLEILKKLVFNLKKDNQICILGKKRNKIQEFLFNAINKFMSFMFGYNLYDGSFAQISFGKSALEVLKTIPNSSMYTKVDKWSGVEVIKIEDIPQKIRFAINKKKHFTKLAIQSMLVLVPMFCWIFIGYVKKTYWLKFLFAFIMAISLSLLIIEIIVICVKRFVGNNECDKINIEKKGE